MKDTEILDLYFARDEQAIAQTQSKYGTYCFSIAFHILHDQEDSDECVNDTWMRAWNSIPPNRPDHLNIFLGTITRNLSFDRYKKKKAMKRGSGDTFVQLDELEECIPDANSSTEAAVEAAELQTMINDFLKTLPEKECNVFLRRYWYSEEYADIAKRYGMNLNSVKTSLFRTRAKLKAFLEKQGITV
ncbi:MAG: sigma-70 family RNA polymerase sigma factor [Lachnospiraceae bacterium]|nr:sigma-70 family RNA polymerase sigma factor [Lachnospiraceae bacterium]MBQ3905716.1 sigma-70 family RNA polymerase sigma factor [Lachnospiraceae bacterium]